MLTKGQTISIGKVWPTASIFLVLMTSERNILFSFTFVNVGSYITDAQFYKNPKEQADERTRCFKGNFLCWERLSMSIIGLQRIYHGTLQSWPSRPHSDQPADEVIQSSHNIIDLAKKFIFLMSTSIIISISSWQEKWTPILEMELALRIASH